MQLYQTSLTELGWPIARLALVFIQYERQQAWAIKHDGQGIGLSNFHTVKRSINFKSVGATAIYRYIMAEFPRNKYALKLQPTVRARSGEARMKP